MKSTTLLFLLLCLLTTRGQTATFCVTDATGLRNALSIAGSNNSFDSIKISTGTYQTNGDAFSFYDENAMGLEISGGWTQITSTPCSAQLGGGLFHTVLDADSTSSVMNLLLQDGASLTISNLAFINGLSSDVAGLKINKFDPDDVYTGTYLLEHNVFANNSGSSASALSVNGYDRLDIRNNLFLENTSGATIYIDNNLGSDTVLNNNTLVDNEYYVYTRVYDSSRLMLANNTMRSLGQVDFYRFGDGELYLYNNNLGSYFSNEPAMADSNNFTLPNRFVDGVLQFTPAEHSPLVDAGRRPCGLVCIFPRPFTSDWVLGDQDMEGQNRDQGQSPDVGAFESSHTSDLLFMHTFD